MDIQVFDDAEVASQRHKQLLRYSRGLLGLLALFFVIFSLLTLGVCLELVRMRRVFEDLQTLAGQLDGSGLGDLFTFAKEGIEFINWAEECVNAYGICKSKNFKSYLDTY